MTKRPGMIDFRRAVRDPKLLGTVRWYPRQLAILDSLAGPERRHIAELGRQSGKGLMFSALAVHNACLRPDLDAVLPPGITRDVLVCTPRQDQAAEFVQTCAAHVAASPLLRGRAEVQAQEIRFDNGGHRARILALPANARTIRGYRASLVIYDEMAYLDEAGGPGSAEALWRALTPSTRPFGADGRIVCSSTPNGTRGKFADLVQQAENGWQNTVYHHAPTWDVVPVSPEEREEWKSELGQAWFDQEYGAERVEGAGAFFDLANIPLADGPALPASGTNWVAGVDPATIRDKFGLVVVGEAVEDCETLLVGTVASLEAGGSGLLDIDRETSVFKQNLERCWQALEPYVPHGLRIATDTAKSQAVRSFFGRRGIEPEVVSLQGRERVAAFISAKTRIADESLRLYEHPDLMEDLRTVQMRDSETIHLPRLRGRHCDCASALVNAVWLLAQQQYAAASTMTLPSQIAADFYSGSTFG